MSEHEWKIGDWAVSLNRRCRFVSTVKTAGTTYTYFVFESGHVLHSSNATPLPNCDSWDWQPTPKLQLREGAWYERADGKIVGPCSPGLETIPKWKFQVDSAFYDEEGDQVNRNAILDLIREVPAPAPKYRPFANAAEFAPHRDRWLRSATCVGRIENYSDVGVVALPSARLRSYDELLEKVVFDDTGLPCGVEVME